MSSGSENSVEDAALEIGRLTKLWETMKQAEDMSVRQAIHAQQQKNLQTRLRITEGQLSKANENTGLLMKQLLEAQDQNEVLLQLQYLRLQLKQQTKLTKTLQQKLSVSYSYKQQKQKQKENRNKQSRVEEYSQMQSMIKDAQIKDRKLNDISLHNRELQLENDRLNSQLERCRKQNQQLRNRLIELEQKVNQMYLQEESNGITILQINELKANIQRLLFLLRQTGQFNNFVLSGQDSQGFTFLKNVIKRIKGNDIITPPTFKSKKFNRYCTCMEIKIDQKYLWVPIDARKIMSQIKKKYSSITEDCIEEVLFELNQIWSAREDAHLRRFKESYQENIQILRKKNNAPYDQLVAKKQISRLKKQITKVKYQKMDRNPLKSFQNLKKNGQFQDHIKEKQKQIKYLHGKIHNLQGETANFNQVMYLEGALWIISKVYNEIKLHRQDFQQLQGELWQRIGEGEQQGQINWMRVYKWFMQGVQQMNRSLQQKVRVMQQSTKQKVKTKKSR